MNDLTIRQDEEDSCWETYNKYIVAWTEEDVCGFNVFYDDKIRVFQHLLEALEFAKSKEEMYFVSNVHIYEKVC